MAYRVDYDGVYSQVVKTTLEPNGINIYKTFREAKAELINHINYNLMEWRYALKRCRLATAKTVENSYY